jgi:DNA-directed RNA polymerase subunit F|tara:strand:- start:920 stop:1153 length:234 start_codon:yes stop_codon:yes gene_type:complete
MNKEGRKQLEEAMLKIAEAKEIIEQVREEEQEKLDNLEAVGLEYSPNGEKMQEAIDALYEAEYACETCDEQLQEASA